MASLCGNTAFGYPRWPYMLSPISDRRSPQVTADGNTLNCSCTPMNPLLKLARRFFLRFSLRWPPVTTGHPRQSVEVTYQINIHQLPQVSKTLCFLVASHPRWPQVTCGDWRSSRLTIRSRRVHWKIVMWWKSINMGPHTQSVEHWYWLPRGELYCVCG